MNNYSKYFSHYIAKNFATALFSIFIPVYLYANGFSLFEVGAFYLTQEIVNFVFTYILYQKIYSWGIRSVTIVAVLSQILFVLITYNYLNPNYIFLLTLAFFKGIHDSFYWGAYGLFMVHLSGKNTGNFLGKWYFLNTVFATAMIPLSGYILDNHSPFWLVIISIILLAVSIIPLVNIKLEPLKDNIKIRIGSFLQNKENRYIIVMSHLNEFLTKIQQTFVPIFTFFIFNKFFSVGIAAIFATIGEGIYSLAVGSNSDKNGTRKKLLYFNIFGFLIFLLPITVAPEYFVFVILMFLAFFRVGTVISSEAGINKSCQKSECYSKKLLSRMSENTAGMFIGIIIMISGLANFSTAFILCGVYILAIFFRITKFSKYI